MSSGIFREGATYEKAESARQTNFIGAIAVGDLVKSTLGPHGMDKILQSASGQGENGGLMVTNDGATILKSIALDNAAAKVLVNMSKVQDDEVGDGTTSVCVLAAELLRRAEKLVEQRIHPQIIIEGFREAATVGRAALEASAEAPTGAAEQRQRLISLACTTLSSKIVSEHRELFAELCVQAVERLQGSTELERIQILKKVGGRLEDSYLEDGFLLNKKIGVNQPKRVANARILVANTGMDTDKVKVFGARMRVEDTRQLAELERAERERMRAKVERIVALGPTVFINRQLIYNFPEQIFAERGVMAIEHADFEGVERLALVTGAEIASTFDDPALIHMGSAAVVEEVLVGGERMVRFSGVPDGRACTLVLRGATVALLDEADRSVHDALAVVSQTTRDPRFVFGAGCAEMLMSRAVDDHAATIAGKKALAVAAFAEALRALPAALCANAGLDAADLVARLRAAHHSCHSTAGIDLTTGTICDARDTAIVESLHLKRSVLRSAAEAAEMILRVDDIIRCRPRERRNY